MSKAKKLRRLSFSPEDRVLCYEPDPTKARVLYDSKVVEAEYCKEDRGRRTTKYLIHFNGWNRSWDRWVTENMILDITKENKMIQKQLNEEAKRKNRKRSLAFGGPPSAKRRYGGMGDMADSSSSGSDSEESSDDSSSQYTSSDDSDDSDDNVPPHCRHSQPGNPAKKESLSVFADSDDDDFEEDSRKRSNRKDPAAERNTTAEPATGPATEECHEIPLEIPAGLREILEEDCMQVTQHAKLHKLPAVPCASLILDKWLEFMATQDMQNQVSSTVPARASCSGVKLRSTPAQKTSKIKSKSIPPVVVEPSSQLPLCHEVAGSLKILLDFLVASHLLYDKERNQYGRLVKRRPSAGPGSTSQSLHSVGAAAAAGGGAGSGKLSGTAPRHAVATVAEVSSTVDSITGSCGPSRQPSAAAGDACDAAAGGDIESARSSNSHLGRASVTEHSYSRAPEYLVIAEAARVLEQSQLKKAEAAVCSHSPASDGDSLKDANIATSQKPPPVSDTIGPRQTRSRSLNVSVKIEPDTEQASTPKQSSKTKGEKAAPPISASKHLNVPTTFLTASYCQSKHAVNFGTRPSEVYGFAHLLRLFVYLPTVLSRMEIGDGHMQVLYEHLYMILAFLNEHRETFHADVQYHKPT